MAAFRVAHPTDPAVDGPARDRTAAVAAFLVRIIAALLWLDNLSWKVPPRFGIDDDAGLYYFTTFAVDHPVLPPYSALVENVVLPNFLVFAWGVYLLEICLAGFLLIGLATRFWAVLGILQSLAIFLSVGAAPEEWKWSYFLMIATHLAILGFASGRVWGADMFLRRKLIGTARSTDQTDGRRPLPVRLYLAGS